MLPNKDQVTNKRTNQVDPLTKQPERGVVGEDLSPIAPPEAYAPPAGYKVNKEAMHPLLKEFMRDHVIFTEECKRFEESIHAIQKDGYTREHEKKLSHFFHFFDEHFIPHSRKEEATFFPLLKKRLVSIGEHTKGNEQNTAIDLMEDDHTKAVQLATLVFNFLGLAPRLPDPKSQLIVLDAALEQAKNLIELLRLHMFREDNIIFAEADRLLLKSELDRMQAAT